MQAELLGQQDWLIAAYNLTRSALLPEAPDVSKVVVSYGFPKGSHGRRKAIGQHWGCGTREGHSGIIFVHPCQWSKPVDVLHVLIHEMIHAVHPAAGHRKEFSQLAARVGLLKPWTATTPSDSLTARLNDEFVKTLPEFPAASFDHMARTKQASRLRLWECGCGIKVRVASDTFAARCEICSEVFVRGGNVRAL